MPSQVLNACNTWLRRARGLVRPGAAGLLIGIECSRVRDSLWMYLTFFLTTRIRVELVIEQRKLPDCVVVGLQLYSARTFHVRYIHEGPPDIKGRAGTPSKQSSTPKAIQTTQDVGYYANSRPKPVLNLYVPCTIEF